MSLFSPQDGPRIFATPPGVDFSQTFAEGLQHRLIGAPPEALARVTVQVNTQRTVRAMRDAFERLAPGCFLPRIGVLTSVAGDVPRGTKEVSGITRVLALAKMVRAFLDARPDIGAPSPANAAALASSVASLLDECTQERVSVDALAAQKVDPNHAAHWETLSTFFRHIATIWPRILRDDFQGVEAQTVRAEEVDRAIAALGATPPTTPLIAAGSTGSRRLTLDLLAAISRTRHGAVVLPGFDFDANDNAWRAMNDDHPQARFRRLLDRLEVSHRDVKPWLDSVVEAPVPPRGRLLSQALRPAPVTHEWRAARKTLAMDVPEAMAAVEIIEAPSPRWEAEAIACAARHELSRADASVAIVTADRSLGRRVAAALGRWGLTPDDSSGEPLSLTSPGVFLRLTAEVLARGFDHAALLDVLKHPLCNDDEDQAALRKAVRFLERKGFRRPDIAVGLTDMDALLVASSQSSPTANAEETPLVAPILRPLIEALRPWRGAAPLGTLIEAHLDTARVLAGEALWDKKAGIEAERAMRSFAAAAGIIGEISPTDYLTYLRLALAEGGDVREEAYIADQRIKILGPLEARAQSTNLMILAGLNEGSWPRSPAVDPWLSRPMRAALNMPSPEQATGLSAHDFQQAAAAPRVILSRSLKADGAPTMEARWLTRLRTLLDGVAPNGAETWKERCAAGTRYLSAAEALDAPDGPITPAPRPAPCPPIAARPRRISVTDVEKLIRDPYDVYARRVLNLYPLDPIGTGPDARQRGIVLHAVMESFVEQTKAGMPPDPGALYDQVADTEIKKARIPAGEALAWRARLDRVKDWFLNAEATRRAGGTPVDVEIRGDLEITTSEGTVNLTGVADRVDRLSTGELAIYDYKAGSAPSQKQVDRFAKQLPLLAAMASEGVLKGVPKADAALLAYLGLTGAGDGGKETPITVEADALSQLTALLEYFNDPQSTYRPRTYVEKTLTYSSDFEHLSRFGEWADEAPAEAPPGAPTAPAGPSATSGKGTA